MIYLILASSWRALPFITLLLLAAMQTVSTEVIESSRIDGANGWQVVRHIMIPLMLPTLVVAHLQPHPQRHERGGHDLQPHPRRAGLRDVGAELYALQHWLGSSLNLGGRRRWPC